MMVALVNVVCMEPLPLAAAAVAVVAEVIVAILVAADSSSCVRHLASDAKILLLTATVRTV
jgi:hypothetical protein